MNEETTWILVGSVLDDLIATHDLKKAIAAETSVKLPPTPAPTTLKVEQREEPRVRRSRARSKIVKDQQHLERHKEKIRIFASAHRDVLSSPGEIDALSDSKILGITRADVLIDHKLRVPGGYSHPSLRREPAEG